MSELTKQTGAPPSNAQRGLYTTRQYPCGCRAEGPGDVPDYCAEHGLPPSLRDPAKVRERGTMLEQLLSQRNEAWRLIRILNDVLPDPDFEPNEEREAKLRSVRQQVETFYALARVCPICHMGSGMHTLGCTGDSSSGVETTYQARVVNWARECFGDADTTNRAMRTFRFLEEALELAQACGCTREQALRVLCYVYDRPAGVIAQETGGTMVSLAVLCQAWGIDMDRCAEDELTRVLGKVEHIRARHAGKPDFGSPVKASREGLCREGFSAGVGPCMLKAGHDGPCQFAVTSL